jgi:transcriptional regulator with XRE-family HTH domain
VAVAGDPEALGQLLRSRRERLLPDDVGLPAGRRRRTAGLRREEVALLASLSTTYYTFLEQGRPVRPSAQVLDALASALRMTTAERRYLQVLAHGRDGAGSAAVALAAPPERIDPGVVDLVQRLDPFPTFVKGRRWDVLTSNAAARELFTDWEALPSGERNLVRWMFMTDRARAVYLEWEPEARAMSGHDVTAVGSGSKKLRHPRLGPVDYSHVVLQVADRPDQTLVTYSAAGTSSSP